MQYKDLKEMTVKDWDGQPFYALVEDDPEEEIWGVDDERLDGEVEGFLVSGYCQGRWLVEANKDWSHVYPIEWNKKPKKRMTNRQLAMWLAKGNGELSSVNLVNSYHFHSYLKSEANDFVYEGILVRKWDSEEWIKPTVDLLED